MNEILKKPLLWQQRAVTNTINSTERKTGRHDFSADRPIAHRHSRPTKNDTSHVVAVFSRAEREARDTRTGLAP